MTGRASPPGADARQLVADYLGHRLAGPDGAVGHPVTLRVAPLGATDALWSEPELPGHTELLGTDTADLLPVHLHGATALVGPFGGERPCFHCLARRWQHLRTNEERDALETGRTATAPHTSPFLTGFALEGLWQLVRHVVRTPPGRGPVDRHGHPYVHELRLDDLGVWRYPLVADAQCPRCGRPVSDTADGARVALRSRRKRSPDDFRITPVTGYGLERDAYANPVCGAVGAGAHPRLISTTTANAKGYLGIRGGGYIHDTHWSGHSDSYDRSALLGIMEAHERIAGTQPRRLAGLLVDTHRNLGASALDPAECGLYTDEFYAGSPHYVPYHPDLPIPWVWGYSLRDERSVLVPAAITYYHLGDQRNRFVQECSNGCASGGCPEEAILHGLLELVERDAFVTAWFAGPRLPEIDPRSCARVHTRLLIDRISMYGYDIRLFDARIQFPVPVVVVVAQRRDGGMGTLLFGAGASLDPEQAIASGLYEIAAGIPTFKQNTERIAGVLRAKAADFDLVHSLSDHAPLFGLPEMARYARHLLGDTGRPADLPPVAEVYRDWQRHRPRTLDLLDDLLFCVRSVTRAGFDVIAVDQTSPEQAEISLNTASVVVPGLLPIDFGWRRQRALHLPRTRTVLREAGLRDRDLDPAELNRAPHPFP